MNVIKNSVSWSDHTLRIITRWILLFGVFQVIVLLFRVDRFTVGFFLLYLFFIVDAIAFRLQMGETSNHDQQIEPSMMDNEEEINKEILALLMEIESKTPELSKYLGEMPVTLVNGNSQVSLQNLKDYHNSLQNLLKNYMVEQKQKQNDK